MNRPILVPVWLAVLIALILAGGSIAAIKTVPGVPSSVPTQMIVLATGACPSDYTAVTAADGFYLVAMASGLGSTLGTAMASVTDSSYTPAGTNGTVSFTPAGTNGTVSFTPAGTFAGNALATHTHTESVQNSDTGIRVNQTPPFGTGSSQTYTHSVTPTDITDAATNFNLTSGTSGGTPAGTFTGTAGTVPAQTFTGTAGTIPAQTFTGTANATMRSTISPTYQVRLCRAP